MPVKQVRIRQIALDVPQPPAKGVRVYARGLKEYGYATGAERYAQARKGRVLQVEVLWPDGERTWPSLSTLRKVRHGLVIL